jgi:hypothetical protein
MMTWVPLAVPPSFVAVNARFTTPPTPDTTYTVVRVSRKP